MVQWSIYPMLLGCFLTVHWVFVIGSWVGFWNFWILRCPTCRHLTMLKTGPLSRRLSSWEYFSTSFLPKRCTWCDQDFQRTPARALAPWRSRLRR